MSDVRPLWIYDPEGKMQHDALRAAKAALELPYRIVPERLWEGDVEVRVLAWRTPPFACAYALVTDRTRPDVLQKMLAWALGEDDENDAAMSVADVLTAWLGPGVREITAEELAAEQRFAEYEAGR